MNRLFVLITAAALFTTPAYAECTGLCAWTGPGGSWISVDQCYTAEGGGSLSATANGNGQAFTVYGCRQTPPPPPPANDSFESTPAPRR